MELKKQKKVSNYLKNRFLPIKNLELKTFEITSMEKSWKCCKCNSENYNNKYTCSWCRHSRCSSCKNLLG